MTNKDYIKVGKERIKYLLDDIEHHKKAKKYNLKLCQSINQINALTYFIDLAKDYEQAKAGLPEKATRDSVEMIDWSDDDINSYNLCLHQAALGLVKFKKKLPEIIKEKHIYTDGVCDTDTFVTVPINALITAILKEL